jgi:hypothetical protein
LFVESSLSFPVVKKMGDYSLLTELLPCRFPPPFISSDVLPKSPEFGTAFFRGL